MVATTPPDLLTDTAEMTATTPRSAAQAAALLERVPVMDDVIEYTIACALALSPPSVRTEMRELIAKQASMQSRKVFGGERLYISRKIGEASSERNTAIRRDYWQHGEHIPLLERRYKLSAAHLWRIIKS